MKYVPLILTFSLFTSSPALASEVNRPLSDAVPAELEEAVQAAAARLVALQENMDDPKGEPCEWPYEGVYREGGQIPPGYRVGGTSIAAWALLEVPGYDEDEARKAAVERGLGFVLTQLEDEPRMAGGFRGGYDVRGWGHTYALEFLLHLREKGKAPADQQERVEAMIRSLIERLEGDAISETGGWNYARRGGAEDATAGTSPFMTGPTVLALERAGRNGFQVQSETIAAAKAALRKALVESDVSSYNSSRSGRDTVAGSTGRVPVSYLALGPDMEGREEGLQAGVEAFFQHWDELEKRRRKTGTHVAPHGIAPYYFFYAHLYAALAIEALPQARRREFRARYLGRLFHVREDSGGWNDRVFERSENYGTAMAILALQAPDWFSLQ